MRILCFFIIASIILIADLSNAQPVASFTVSRYKVCSGKSVILTNNSTGSDIFKWYVDNTYYSSNRDETIVLSDPCFDRKPVKLVATNSVSGLSDSMTIVVEVFDACDFHLTGDFSRCVGDTIRLKSHPEAVAVQWNIEPPAALLEGCFSCDSITFVLLQLGTLVDLHSTYDGNCSQTTSFHYGWCNSVFTAIPEDELLNLEIYPNPFSNFIYLKNQEIIGLERISLFNEYGMLVRNIRLSGNSVDLQDLPPGLYILKWENNQTSGVKRIIKQL